MLSIKEQKQNVLNEIMLAYETYRGNTKSQAEQTIQNLYSNNKITYDEHISLLMALNGYKQYLLNILASSIRVRVDLRQLKQQSKECAQQPLKELDKLWQPLTDPLDIT